MLFLNSLCLAATGDSHPDYAVWVAIFISILSVIISLWRNSYDIENDKDKRVKEMVASSVRRIEEIDEKWDERIDKLDGIVDKISDATHSLQTQVAKLNAQVSFLIRDNRGSKEKG